VSRDCPLLRWQHRLRSAPEADHPNHFTVIEEWTTSKSRDAHLIAAHTRAFRERLLPMEGALYDARLYNELD
jgi:quinol monooxygenase YgiN